jgi:predicted transcriptional regulator
VKVSDELIIMFEEKTILKIRGRTRHGLIASMLESCREPKLKTDLFYETRIPYRLLGTILGFCLETKLLSENNRRYETTQKGSKFLKQFRGLLDLLK